MFDDREKPFYKLFEKMYLKKIKAEYYLPFLQKVSLQHWKKELAPSVIEEILQVTECHPYYVNRLSYQL